MKKLISAFLTLILCVSSFSGLIVVSAEEGEEQEYTISASGFNESYPPENAFDGKTSTFTSIGSGTKLGDYKVWLMADLGSPQIINSVSVRSRRDIDQENSRKQWVLEVANKSDFSDAVIIGEKPEPGERNSDLEVTPNSKIPYRYVRINSTWSYMVVSEFEIDSTPIEAGSGSSFEDLQGTSIEKRVKLLEYLGLVEGINVIEYGAHTLVTRGYAASLVAKLMRVDSASAKEIYADVPAEHEYASAIAALYQAGVIADAQSFKPDEDIRLADFLKMIIYALGYSTYITTSDLYEAAIASTAMKLELLDDVEYDTLSQNVNKEQASQIIYNALLTEALEVDQVYWANEINGQSIVNKSASGKTYLEYMFKISFTEGILSGNAITTLTSDSGLGTGNVRVNGTDFVDADGLLQQSLGKNVICFYDEDDKIVCGWEEENSQTTFRVEDIESIDAISTHKAVYVDDNNKSRTLKLKSGVDVIRNGVCDLTWTNAELLENAEAELTFIDNNRDNIYDVIMLEAPQIIILDYATSDTNNIKLVDYSGTPVAIDNIEKLTINKNGATAKASALKKNDVIYMYASKNSSAVRIEAYSNLISGKAELINQEEIVIAGTEYEFSNYYLANKALMQAIKVGVNISVALNKYDEIVWVFDNPVLGETDFLAFIYDTIVSADGIEPDMLKLFTADGDHLKLGFADSVTVDGKRYKTCNTINAVSGADYFKNKFAVVKVVDNCIVYLDTENNDISTEPESNLINCGYNDDETYRYYKNSAGMFANNDIMEIPLKSDTKLFTIPCDDSGAAQTDSQYRRYYNVSTVSEGLTGSTQRGEYAYGLAFYNADEFGYPEFGVCFKKYNAEGGGIIDIPSASSMLLNKVIQKQSADGEIQYNLTGIDLINGKEVTLDISPEITVVYDSHKVQQADDTDKFNSTTRLLKADKDLSAYEVPISNLACGDILRYQQAENEVYSLERVFDGSDSTLTYTALARGYYYATSTSNVNLPNASYKLFCGTLDRVSTDAVILNIDGDSATRVFEISNKYILERDREGYKAYSSVQKVNIEANQKAVILTTSGTPRSVILY